MCSLQNKYHFGHYVKNTKNQIAQHFSRSYSINYLGRSSTVLAGITWMQLFLLGLSVMRCTSCLLSSKRESLCTTMKKTCIKIHFPGLKSWMFQIIDSVNVCEYVNNIAVNLWEYVIRTQSDILPNFISWYLKEPCEWPI